MRVNEVMTREVFIANPEETIRDAAKAMVQGDIGFIPVGEDGRLVGTLTDRDIAVRAVAQGRGPDTRIRDVMSNEVKYCFADEDCAHVARNMGDVQVRRLPVLDRDKRLVGILSLGDLAVDHGADTAGQALSGVSRQRGQHSQSSETRW